MNVLIRRYIGWVICTAICGGLVGACADRGGDTLADRNFLAGLAVSSLVLPLVVGGFIRLMEWCFGDEGGSGA